MLAVTFLAALLCGVAGDLTPDLALENTKKIGNLLNKFDLDRPTDFDTLEVEENFTLSTWNVSSRTYEVQLKQVCKVAGLDALGSACDCDDCASALNESSYNVTNTVMEKACMWLCEGPCVGNTSDNFTTCKDQIYYYCFKKYMSQQHINAFINNAEIILTSGS